ncbi:substrate-binding domain-containing protein [Corynebacterium mastitidis]|uniref:LysR family transcriptional regulator n=1 Tax=Corynebacterium mastitidis TaxID=161890 RepID=A0A2N0X8Z9_9CORY|nr:LysR substrate-binding domain-containing protein [Corynebacterium mastitidis]MCH6196414.1 substrate-binding domain-containing protein [Corynebacterium mastitidis]PKF69196.1 LysR family transcriptional regulator [Corynebacterium mastitidis]
MLRLAFVTGTEPGKWFDRFAQRTDHGGLMPLDSEDPLALLEAGEADLALARLPDARVGQDHHVVRLYAEARGVAVPKGSIFAEAGDPVGAADLAGEMVQYRVPASGEVDVAQVRAALAVVAANVGVAIAPRPLLKILSRKQVVPLPLAGDADERGEPVPETHIALVWRREADSDAIQDFVGIARGRTRNSSRQAAPRRSAREKTKARQERRAGRARGEQKKTQRDQHRAGRNAGNRRRKR